MHESVLVDVNCSLTGDMTVEITQMIPSKTLTYCFTFIFHIFEIIQLTLIVSLPEMKPTIFHNRTKTWTAVLNDLTFLS